MLLVSTVDMLMELLFYYCDKSMISLLHANRSTSTIELCDLLDEELSIPITCHGILTHFNGIDVLQTRTHITISVGKYLTTIFESHGWNSLIPLSLPMLLNNYFVKALDSAVPLDPDVHAATDKSRFRYCGAIGELIWPRDGHDSSRTCVPGCQVESIFCCTCHDPL
jgi:hypothetical protein